MFFKQFKTFAMWTMLLLIVIVHGSGTTSVLAEQALYTSVSGAYSALTSSIAEDAPAADYAWHTFYGTSSGLQGGIDDGKAVTTDGDGNIYIAGTSESTWNGPNNAAPMNAFAGGNPNIVVIKLNSAGAYQWHTFFGSVSNDYGHAITSDGDGNIYVTGTSVMEWYGPGGAQPIRPYLGANSEDIVIIKLNSAGTYQWHTFYGSPGNADSFGDDYGYAIAQDASGVYVVGHSDLTWNGPGNRAPLTPHPGYTSMVVLKVNTAGSYQWHSFYGPSGPAWGSFGYAVTSDSNGSVYAAGYSMGWNGPGNTPPLNPYSGGNVDIAVVKLNSAGAYQWHTFYGSSSLDRPNAITSDNSGNIILTGHSMSSWNGPGAIAPLNSYAGSGAANIVVVKLNSAGNYQWHTFYGVSGQTGRAVTSDEQGNIYVASDGASWNGPGNTPPLNANSGADLLVLKLNSSGSYQWHTFAGSIWSEYAYAIANDGFGNLIVTGTGKGSWNGPGGVAPLNPYHHAPQTIGSDILVLKLDVTPLTVTIEQSTAQSDPTSAFPISFDVLFSSPVNGFDAADIDLSASTVTGALSVIVTESAPHDGTTYQVAVTGMTGSGNVIASIPAGAAQDATGNTSKASTSLDNSVFYELQEPTVHYVKWDANGANNGSSWEDAYTDLQLALAAASSGDEIWVAAGVYVTTTTTDRTISFALPGGVKIYGGFNGTETVIDQRDPETNLSRLSGDIGAPDAGDNSYHVVRVENPGDPVVLDGFWITGGTADGNSPHNHGGGIYHYGGILTVANSIFHYNYSVITPDVVGAGEGGAIYSTLGTLTVSTSTFYNNAASRGGAIRCSGGTLNVTDVSFYGNTATSGSIGDGGAVYTSCNSTFANDTFAWNNGYHYGGAMLTDNDLNDVTITNSTFYDNQSLVGGGLVNYGRLIVTNSTFSNNVAPDGGALKNGLGGILSLRNSILANSQGGVDCIRSDSTPEIENINNLIETTGADPESCGVSLLTSDPLLASLGNNGGATQTMALLAGSPAIDAGNAASCPTADQRGELRSDGACDLGAYELAHHTISGNTGIGGVTLNFPGGTRISDEDGNYSLPVPNGWSGTITPSKSGYRFTPQSRNYSNVNTDQIAQDYTATPLITISGNAGTAGATISYTDSTPKWVAADSLGNYSFQVPVNWTGTVTPSKSGYIFSPVSRDYSNIQTDQTGQDYVATRLYTISGNVGVVGATLQYDEDGIPKTVVADSSGNYSFVVKAGWSGTVVPSRNSVTFVPTSRTYSNVQANQTAQNFVATIIVDSTADNGSGTLRQALADSVSGTIINFDPALAGQTITLASTLTSNKSVTIDGSTLNPRVEISGNHAVRIFYLGDFGTNITLRSLVLKNGYVPGAGGRGAAILVNSSQLTIEDVSFVGNSTYNGGAIYSYLNNVHLRIVGSTFDSNAAEQQGGAIFMEQSFLTLQSSSFRNNTAGSTGGALYLHQDDSYLIENSTFEHNSAVSGGAIHLNFINQPVIVRGNTFVSNAASNIGGAIFEGMAYTGNLSLENNTFYANLASRGGAVFTSDARIKNNTFSNNEATQSPTNSGASVYLWAPMDIKLYNNIMANNSGGGECHRAGSGVIVLEGGSNLIEDGSSLCLPSLSVDPLLGPLQNNSGGTETMAISADSAAVNAADAANCPALDQRGVTRPQGSACDIGAFEYVFPPTPTPTNTVTPSDTPIVTPTFTYTPTYTATSTPAIFTLTLQPDAATGVDSYIYSGNKTTNFGSSIDLGVGEDTAATNRMARSLIRFDLSSIPSDATITSATLSLWTSTDLSSNTRTIRVYRLKVPFNESQVTWSRPAAGASWQVVGASGANDRESTDMGSLSILDNEALNAEKQIVLTPARIQELVNGTAVNNGFIIVADTEINDRFNYMSSDSSITSQRPKLVVQYTLPSATPTQTATVVPSDTPTATYTASSTSTPTATETAIAIPTSTFTRTATATRTPTRTVTVSPTRTPTRTITPSRTPTNTPSQTYTATAADTFTPTVTPTATLSPTYTSTATTTPVGLFLYVKWDATGANDGTSWENAYTDLQSALAVATSGQKILVAGGMYKPTSGTDRTVSFVLKNEVEVYGGFAGFGWDRDYEAYETILSGDIGVVGDSSDNSYHVVVGSNTDNTAVLDGFTITGGNGNSNVSPFDKGGGMYNFHGSPSVSNVIITENFATFGGGMNNESFMQSESSNPSLMNVSFINNSALEGGGMRNMYYSSPTLENVKFQNNSVVRSGGGMTNMSQNDVTMRNVEFSGNVAGTGGGLANIDSNPSLWNVTFSNNSAEWGGAISNAGSSPSITNGTFYGNSATTYGGAISNESNSNPTLINVTISGNSAVTFGGGIYNEFNGAIVYNSIVYGNSGGAIYNNAGSAAVSYSIIQGGYPGTGNIDADPLLGPLQDNGGFTQTMALLAGSPAIDAAEDANCPPTDQRGIARPQGDGCDMGAFEYESLATPPPMDIPTFTPSSTATYVPSFTPTLIPTATFTQTLIPTPTPTRTSTLSPTPIPTETPTFTPTFTATATHTATSTPTATAPQLVTLTLNSVAGNDGWILESSENSDAGGSINATTSTFNVGDDKSKKQSVGILHFDTSSLPDNAVITSVTLRVQKQSITGTDPFTTHGNLVLDVQKPYFGTTSGLVADDFQAAAGQAAVSTFNPTPVDNWYSAAFDTAVYAYIDLTGTTQFRLRFSLDDDNDTIADVIKFYSGEAGAPNQPQLIIEYYVP